MKKLIFTTFVFLASQNLLIAQGSYGIKAGLGISKIPFGIANYKSQNEIGFSQQIGFFYDFSLKENNKIGFEVLLNRLSGSDSYQSELPLINYDLDYSIFELSVPIIYRIDVSKMEINLGIRPSIVLSSNMKGDASFEEGSNPYLDTKLPLDDFILGAQLGIGYKINDRIKVGSTFYNDLGDIHDGNYGTKLRTWQVVVDIKYALK